MAKKRNPPSGGSGWLAWAKIVEALLDRFGWPGFLLVYGIYFIEHNATQDQKHAIIDLYFLGRGIDIYYPLIVLVSVFVLVFFAQRYFYRKKLATMEKELRRLGEWKTSHQEQRTGASLHHSENKEE